jgi:RNA polymerase sigma factor (sigma-70 family)
MGTAGARCYDPNVSGDDARPDPFRDDAELIERYLREDREAVAVLDGWLERAAGPFRRRLGAEWPDVLQEVRVEVLHLLAQGRFRGESRLRTYVWRVVAHTCLDAVRRQRRRPVLEGLEMDAALPSPAPTPLDEVLCRDRDRRLLRALEASPPECRELWRLILQGASYREISARTGVTEGALRVRAHRCRKSAAEQLARNETPAGDAKGSKETS